MQDNKDNPVPSLSEGAHNVLCSILKDPNVEETIDAESLMEFNELKHYFLKNGRETFKEQPIDIMKNLFEQMLNDPKPSAYSDQWDQIESIQKQLHMLVDQVIPNEI